MKPRQTTGGLLVLLLATALQHALAAQTSNSFYQSTGTKRMAERLEKIARESNPAESPFLNAQRAEMFRSMIAHTDTNNLSRYYDLMTMFATQLLNCGKNEEAIDQFERIEKLLTDHKLFGKAQKSWVRQNLAVSHLRIGELDNCLNNHTIDSCLMPIRAGGVHKIQRGSRGAIKILTEQLAEFPDDLSARWLINIAYMTV